MHGNAFGTAAGTSVAAPYVTGLASLLFSKVAVQPDLARIVKERILYTTDFSDNLDSLVRFGLINFTRALSFDKDLTVYKPAFCPESGCESRRPVGVNLDDEVTIAEAETPDGLLLKDERLKVCDIRRIAAKPPGPQGDSLRYWVVCVTDGKLTRLRNVKFGDNATLRFWKGKGPQRVHLADIQYFTAPIR